MESADAELSLVLVDDTRIAEINGSYLDRQGPTNVIAFAMRDGEFGDINPGLLGDVIISMDTCAREAREAGLSFMERFDQLLVHGILHLFGYEHVDDEREAERMEAKSKDLLMMISLQRP